MIFLTKMFTKCIVIAKVIRVKFNKVITTINSRERIVFVNI